MKNKTIIDIANELKISPSTVSRALNDHPFINKNTKALVNKVAKRIGYVPNPIARGLRSNKTSTIGVIVPEIKHDFFSSAISGIEEVAYSSGYTIILSQSNENYEREVMNTQMLANHRVAGIIVSISQNTVNGKHFKEIQERGIPLVFFDRVCKDVNANKVIIDDRKSAFNAVNYLIQKGYKNIAHLAGFQELDICKKRLKGYVDALEKNNMQVNKNLICIGGLHEQDGYSSMDKLFSNDTKVDAVFAINDPVAIGAFQRIKEVGLKIPKDIAVVGFSNNGISNLVEPKLTTVNQPALEMGKKAAEILIALMDNSSKVKKPKTVVFDAELIIRDSA